MRWYVTRRIVWALIVSFIIVTLTFVLFQFSPNPRLAQAQFSAIQHGGNASQAASAFKKAHGMTGSPWDRYVDYMTNFATLNWGWSDTHSEPVAKAVLDAYPYTLEYAVPSVLLSTVIGMGIGLYSATHQYTLADYAATFSAFFGISIPNFWFGIILLLVFAVQLKWLPVTFNPDAALFSLANIKQLILPVIVFSTSAMASQMRYARAESLEYVHATFVKTAKAKGASSRRITFRHIFRPALVPLATVLVGDILALLVASSLLVEVVFGIPGLGRLLVNATIQQDTSLVLGTSFIFVFIGVLGNLAQDLAYQIIDPRIDFGDR